jgi:hypothetical protein
MEYYFNILRDFETFIEDFRKSIYETWFKGNPEEARSSFYFLTSLQREDLENLRNIIPDKHLPLLQYCNTYRVFSVHPKKEKINRANATTILCMTCSFLFDEKLKTKIES